MALRDDGEYQGERYWLVDAKSHYGKTIGFVPVGRFEEARGGVKLGIDHRWGLVSFADFEAMYNLAKAARENDDR